MKRLIFIMLLLVAMATATFAGTGLTITAQGRTVSVEVTDNGIYNVMVLNQNNRLTETRLMNHNAGTFTIDVPQGQDYATIMVVNTCTGQLERFEIPVQ